MEKLHSQVPLKENTRVNESAEPTLSHVSFGQTSAFSMKMGRTQKTPVTELQGSASDGGQPVTCKECKSFC